MSPEERRWIYTPQAERAAGIVEGMKAVVADKLTAHRARAAASVRSRQLAGPGRGVQAQLRS